MARIGGYRVSRRSGFGTIVRNLVALVILLFVADEILSSLRVTVDVDDATSIFYTTYDFLGLDGETIADTTTGGLIGIIGILAAAGVIFSALRIERIG